jgi:dynein heavy chain
MGPPGGGRNPITARLTRHFNHLGFVEMEESSMMTIFGTIFNWWASKKENNPQNKMSIFSTLM